MKVDVNKLKGKMTEKGFTQKSLSKAIGMNPSTLNRKLSAQGLMFTVGEMHEIADVLKLSNNEAAQIFLA